MYPCVYVQSIHISFASIVCVFAAFRLKITCGRRPHRTRWCTQPKCLSGWSHLFIFWAVVCKQHSNAPDCALSCCSKNTNGLFPPKCHTHVGVIIGASLSLLSTLVHGKRLILNHFARSITLKCKWESHFPPRFSQSKAILFFSRSCDVYLNYGLASIISFHYSKKVFTVKWIPLLCIYKTSQSYFLSSHISY